jgi:ABC-type Co2+ transport system permease subunit
MNTSTCEELGTCNASGSPGPDPLLVLPVLLSVLWVVFDLLYASSLAAFVVNRLANLFLKDSGIYVGALRISLLSGRVLFKDVHYYCRDYSVR